MTEPEQAGLLPCERLDPPSDEEKRAGMEHDEQLGQAVHPSYAKPPAYTTVEDIRARLGARSEEG